MAETPSFPLFKSLPTEIRLQIWEAWRDALPSRIISLQTQEGFFPIDFIGRGCDLTNFKASARSISRRFTINSRQKARAWVGLRTSSSLLAPCHEALQVYTAVQPIPGLPKNPSFHFNPDKDIVYFHMDMEFYLPVTLIYPRLQEVKSIAIYRIYNEVPWPSFFGVSNLRKVVLVEWFRYPEKLSKKWFKPKHDVKKAERIQQEMKQSGLSTTPEIRFAYPREEIEKWDRKQAVSAQPRGTNPASPNGTLLTGLGAQDRETVQDINQVNDVNARLARAWLVRNLKSLGT